MFFFNKTSETYAENDKYHKSFKENKKMVKFIKYR